MLKMEIFWKVQKLLNSVVWSFRTLDAEHIYSNFLSESCIRHDDESIDKKKLTKFEFLWNSYGCLKLGKTF